jgi:hypothetical protein
MANGNKQKKRNPQTLSAEEIRAKVERLKSKEGGADAAIELLLGENVNYRTRINELEDELETVQSSLPGEGSLVLDKVQAESWASYQKLGSVKDLEGMVSDHSTLKAKVAFGELQGRFRSAAELVGYDLDVLLDRAKNADGTPMDIEVRTVKAKDADGKEVETKTPYLKYGDGNKSEMPLPDYAEQNWSKYLAALAVSDKKETKPSPTPGVRIPKGSASTTTKTKESPTREASGSRYRRPQLNQGG